MRIFMAALAAGLAAMPAAAVTYTNAQYTAAYQALNGLETLSLMTLGTQTGSTYTAGNARLTSDVGGRVWVSGALDGNSVAVNSGAVANGASNTVKASSTFAALTAGSLASNVQVNSGTNLSPHNAVVGDLNGHSVIQNGAGTTTTSSASAIASQGKTYLQDAELLSEILANPDTGVTAAPTTISSFNALSLANGYNSFTMSGALFGSQNANFDTLFSNLTSARTVVINVTGCSSGSGASCVVAMDQGTNFNGNVGQGLLASNVLWNFTDAAQVTTRNFFGSVLATDASVGISAGNINGSVMSAIFTGGGEIHLGNYGGSEAMIPANDRTVSGVPEPASWATMLGGFGVIGLALRRRRRAIFVTHPSAQ